MKNKEFELDLLRFIKQTIFIFIFIFGHLVVVFLTLPQVGSKFSYFDFVFYFIFLLGIITFPSIFMMVNYLKYSLNKKMIFTNEGIIQINKRTGEKNFIEKKRFKKIYYFSNDVLLSKLPWLFHKHIIIEVDGRVPVVITSYIADVSSFSIDTAISGYFRGVKSKEVKSLIEPICMKKL